MFPFRAHYFRSGVACVRVGLDESTAHMRLVPFSKAVASAPFRRDPFVPAKVPLAIAEIDDVTIYTVRRGPLFFPEVPVAYPIRAVLVQRRRERAGHARLHAVARRYPGPCMLAFEGLHLTLISSLPPPLA